ncbi:MAG: OmpH family outer membrane protein [Bacteroidetes bacterium]|nr:OmpH family outer membrane protein [Bacteroidota bacterium]
MKKLFILLAVVTSLYSCGGADKTAFIDVDKVFNEFELTKQKKAEYENTISKRKEITDKEKLRLQQVYKMLSETKAPDKKEVEKFQIDRQIFEQKLQEDEQQNKAMDDQYTSEIWKQLNQYIEDFRKEEGYTYLFIKSNIVADEAKDVSKAATEFVNKKFKGEK